MLSSIIIGFRNWDLDRLRNCAASISASFGETPHEIIVSDLGSDSALDVGSVCSEIGARHVFTPTNRWSRAEALNRGFAAAKGDLIFVTDADMIFEPNALQTCARELERSRSSVTFLQCRDLPAAVGSPKPVQRADWLALEAQATMRPRWGMGGLVGVSRENFDRVRGLDERMHTYGAEDLDFASRLQRSGLRLLWIQGSLCNMYHVWHPSSSQQAEMDEASRAAVKLNQSILANDATLVRNARSRSLSGRGPLVSVVIATRNRADLLADSIFSVLAQTVTDLEVIVVDDGSTDGTRALVEGFGDERVRYVYQPPQGISVARNHGTLEAAGRYIAVHDDDDIMLPQRLEQGLGAMRDGIRATFGSWVNFDHDTGALTLHVSKKKFNSSTVADTGAAPGHSTWLVEADLMRVVTYDPTLTSAIDNNLAVRLMRSGVRWAHTNSVLFLRRTHSDQVSVTDSGNQKSAATLTKHWALFTFDENERSQAAEKGRLTPWPRISEKEHLERSVVPYLPDHLVVRTVTYAGNIDHLGRDLKSWTRRRASYKGVGKASGTEGGLLFDVPLSDLAVLRRAGIEYQQDGVRRLGAAVRQLTDHAVDLHVARAAERHFRDGLALGGVLRVARRGRVRAGSSGLLFTKHGKGAEFLELTESNSWDGGRLEEGDALLTMHELSESDVKRLLR